MAPYPALYSFDTVSIDKSKVCTDDRIYYAFPFQNTGTSPLVVSSCKSSCGCLTTKAPTKPLFPNEYDTIYGMLATSGKIGGCKKTIVVTFQTIDTTLMQLLRLKCELDSCYR